MAEAAKIQEGNGAAIIDINFGCPVRKVTNGDAGSALMRDLKLAAALIESCVKAVSVPVTVKMRMGWCHDSLNAPELAHIAVDLWLAALADTPSADTGAVVAVTHPARERNVRAALGIIDALPVIAQPTRLLRILG